MERRTRSKDTLNLFGPLSESARHSKVGCCSSLAFGIDLSDVILRSAGAGDLGLEVPGQCRQGQGVSAQGEPNLCLLMSCGAMHSVHSLHHILDLATRKYEHSLRAHRSTRHPRTGSTPPRGNRRARPRSMSAWCLTHSKFRSAVLLCFASPLCR